jgi:putative ABC transport system ATP-binding protein
MADEPTGNLDSKTARMCWILFRLYHGDHHHPDHHDNAIAASARRVIRISDGRIVEDVRARRKWHEAGAPARERTVIR